MTFSDPRAGSFLVPVDKEDGPTSRDIVDRVGHVLSRRDAGHAGTLDPFATGLLLVVVGRATKLVPYLADWEKEYEAVVHLGVATDSLDRTGAVTARSEVPAGTGGRLAAAAAGLVGEIRQAPPMLSAARHGGVRLHRLARRGVVVEREEKIRTVHRFDLQDVALPRVCVRVVCSSGTYVRSLAETFGERLGLPAHLAALRRTRVGRLRVEDAVPGRLLPTLEPAGVTARSIPLAAVLAEWPVWPVDRDGALRVRQGQVPGAPPPSAGPAGSRRWRILGADGGLLALAGDDDDGVPRLLRVLAGAGAESS